jgi:hypothetical protein
MMISERKSDEEGGFEKGKTQNNKRKQNRDKVERRLTRITEGTEADGTEGAEGKSEQKITRKRAKKKVDDREEKKKRKRRCITKYLEQALSIIRVEFTVSSSNFMSAHRDLTCF